MAISSQLASRIRFFVLISVLLSISLLFAINIQQYLNCSASSELITLTSRSPTTQIINLTETATYNLTITNNQQVSDEFEFLVNISSLPGGWRFQMCVGEQCYPLNVSKATFTLKSGKSINADIHIEALTEIYGIYITPVNVTSLANPSSCAQLNLTTILPKYDINLTCPVPSKTITPGSSANYSITVANRGTLEDIIDINTTLLSHSWNITLSHNSIALAPDTNSDITVEIFAPESAQDNDRCDITITGTSGNNKNVSDNVTITATVKIATYYDVAISCAHNNSIAFRNTSVNYTVTVTNTGNARETINLTLQGEHLEWYHLTKSFVILNSSAEAKVVIALNIPLNAILGSYVVTVYAYVYELINKSDKITLTTTVENRLPVVSVINAQTAYIEQIFSLQIYATDADNDILIFSDNTTLFDINSTTGLISFIPSHNSIGVYLINITVCDGFDAVWQVFKLTIAEVNRAPEPIISAPLNNTTYLITEDIYFDCSNTTDPNNDSLLFFWFSNISGFLSNSSKFSASLSPGLHLITLYVNDTHGYNVSTSVIISVVASEEQASSLNQQKNIIVATAVFAAVLGAITVALLMRKYH